MTDLAFTCIDLHVPDVLRAELDAIADRERPQPRARPEEAVGDSRRFWATGRTLRVRFLDSPELIDRVMDTAEEWTDHANLRFQVVRAGAAEVRVTFGGRFNSSAVGTDALCTDLYPSDAPTMHLPEVTRANSSTRVDRVIRHEFGHVLGLVHEHSSPAAGIEWNRPVVYAELTGPPVNWTREQVDRNVFRALTSSTTNFSDFDPTSVMLYTCPAEWMPDGRAFTASPGLSILDKQFAAEVYPGRRRRRAGPTRRPDVGAALCDLGEEPS